MVFVVVAVVVVGNDLIVLDYRKHIAMIMPKKIVAVVKEY